MRTNTTVTLYSRSIANGSETWVRSVIAAGLWESKKAANVIKSGLLEADRVAVYIPDTSISIKVGDVLAKGTVTETISANYTMTNLRADYDVIAVKSVDLMDYGSEHMQHLQIGGS